MRAPFPALLALRYLKSTRKDAFITFLSLVAGLGIALGVAALLLALAALSGFQQVLVTQVLAHTPQIEVHLPGEVDAARARRTAAAVSGVEAVRVLVRGQGWLVVGRSIQAVELVGFDGELPPSVVGRAEGASAREPGLYLPARLAARWGLTVGDRLDVASPRPTLTPLSGPQPRLRTLAVAGLFEGAPPAQGEIPAVGLPRPVAESLLAPVRPRLEIDAGGYERAGRVGRRLAAALPPGSRIETWEDLNRPLLFVLRLEKSLMFVGVFLIVLVAALALVSDLSLIIANKRGEIGMLGAMGATPRALTHAFLLLGGLLGALGALLGTAAGLGTAWVLDHFRAVPLPAGVYFLDYVPFAVEADDVSLVVTLTLALALGSSLYAARRAAALDPVEALRR